MNRLLLVVLIVFMGYIAVYFAVTPVKPLPTVPYVTPTPFIVSEDKLWSLIQDWRISTNRQTYVKDQKLCDFADIRLSQMNDGYINHSGFIPLHRKMIPNSSMAENLISNFPSEEIMLNKWLGSPEHLKDLEADYKYSCLRCSPKDRNTCVQIFANY